jgi:hypothetical protein
MDIVDHDLSNTTIELGTEVFRIHAGARIENCVVNIRASGSQFVLHDCTFINCKIWARRPLINVRFGSVHFEQCQFLGTYKGCDFGSWPFEDHPEDGGGAIDCDFSEAKLDACRLGANSEGALWPNWPHLAILDPAAHREVWSSLPWRLSLNWSVHQDQNADELDFVTASIWNLAKRDPDIDPELIWPFIQDLDWLQCGDKAQKPRTHVPEAPAQYSPPSPPTHSFVCEGWLHEINAGHDHLDLVFDMTRAMAKDVLPNRLILRLTDVTKAIWERDGDHKLTDLPPNTFKVRGFEQDSELVLKGHSKKHGLIRLAYGTEELLLEDRTVADLAQLSEAIEAFWMSKM